MVVRNIISLFSIALIFAVSTGCGRIQNAEAKKPLLKTPVNEGLYVTKIVASSEDTVRMQFVNNQALFNEGWDSIAQPKFWKQIMCLSPDSCIINIASSRTSLHKSGYREWCTQSEAEKSLLKSKLRSQYGVEMGEELFVTNGKREFYEHRKSIPTIAKAVACFKEFGVDPWYAQTILLIESPGKQTTKSYAGANGPFQLMKSVAIKYGLRVNTHVDERADLKRAAFGASRLLSTICIPKVKALLDARNIAYNETDLWFRLMVLHAYHAGAGNLSAAVNKLNPSVGGPQVIRDLWKTEAGGFKNESQNYSQIALAALLNFEEIIRADDDTVFLNQGDRYYSLIKRNAINNYDTETQIRNCLNKYESDLVEGSITYNHFIEKLNELKTELAVAKNCTNAMQIYPDNDRQYILLANELMRKRKSDDAIQLLRLNLDIFPSSAETAEAISKAYRQNGNMGLSQKFMTKSNELANENK